MYKIPGGGGGAGPGPTRAPRGRAAAAWYSVYFLYTFVYMCIFFNMFCYIWAAAAWYFVHFLYIVVYMCIYVATCLLSILLYFLGHSAIHT